MADIFDEAKLEKLIRRIYDGFNKRFGILLEYDVEDEVTRFKVRRKQCMSKLTD